MTRGKNMVWLLAVLTTTVFADDPGADNGKPLWEPKVGDSWTYNVTLEVPEGTRLPMAVAGQKIEELDGKLRASHDQVAVYEGLATISEDGRKAHAFHFSNGDQLEEIQYMLIEGDIIQALGSKQEGENPRKAVLLNTPIPIVDAKWKGGEAFPLIMDQKMGDKTLRMTRQFRAVGWENVETQAGTYNAMYVQVVGMNGGLEIKRGYWFAPGTGFIKEVKKYYVGDKLVMTQTKQLIETSKASSSE